MPFLANLKWQGFYFYWYFTTNSQISPKLNGNILRDIIYKQTSHKDCKV